MLIGIYIAKMKVSWDFLKSYEERARNPFMYSAILGACQVQGAGCPWSGVAGQGSGAGEIDLTAAISPAAARLPVARLGAVHRLA
jgi:hypothetical protein